MTGIRVANAPCSYGAFEITVGVLPDVPDAESVLAAIEAAGYEGTELGPPGYLGDQATLRPRLEQHHLALVGGYIPIRFSEPEHWDEDLTAMSGTLDLFAAGGGDDAKAVLADAGSPMSAHAFRAGRPPIGRSASMTRAGSGLRKASRAPPNWRLAAASSPPSTTTRRRSSRRPGRSNACSSSPMSDCCSTPDTSRSAAVIRPQRCATGDTASTTCTSRMCTTTCSAGVIADHADMPEAWRRGVFCELGAGDVDLDGFFAELAGSGYSGWLVVEQDMVPQSPQDAAAAAASQVRNRAWLAEHAAI